MQISKQTTLRQLGGYRKSYLQECLDLLKVSDLTACSLSRNDVLSGYQEAYRVSAVLFQREALSKVPIKRQIIYTVSCSYSSSKE